MRQRCFHVPRGCVGERSRCHSAPRSQSEGHTWPERPVCRHPTRPTNMQSQIHPGSRPHDAPSAPWTRALGWSVSVSSPRRQRRVSHEISERLRPVGWGSRLQRFDAAFTSGYGDKMRRAMSSLYSRGGDRPGRRPIRPAAWQVILRLDHHLLLPGHRHGERSTLDDPEAGTGFARSQRQPICRRAQNRIGVSRTSRSRSPSARPAVAASRLCASRSRTVRRGSPRLNA